MDAGYKSSVTNNRAIDAGLWSLMPPLPATVDDALATSGF